MQNEKAVAKAVLDELLEKPKNSNQELLYIDVLRWYLDPNRPLDDSCPEVERFHPCLTAGRTDTRGRGALVRIFDQWVKEGSPGRFRSTARGWILKKVEKRGPHRKNPFPQEKKESKPKVKAGSVTKGKSIRDWCRNAMRRK